MTMPDPRERRALAGQLREAILPRGAEGEHAGLHRVAALRREAMARFFDGGFAASLEDPSLDRDALAWLAAFFSRQYADGEFRGDARDDSPTAVEAMRDEGDSFRWAAEDRVLVGSVGSAEGRTKRGRLDVFLHRDLGGALGRRLDAFLEREVLGLEPTMRLAGPELSARYASARALRELGRRVIDALARIEGSLLRLFRKRALVLRSERRVAVARGGEGSHAWDVRVVSSGEGERALERRLALHALRSEASDDGTLVLGDGARALRLLSRSTHEAAQCAYLDPPFNTRSSAFTYDDTASRSSWLSQMDAVVREVRRALREDGTAYVHIDHHEKERLRLLLDRHLVFVAEIIWRIGWVSGFKSAAQKFIRNHDTIYQLGRTARPRFFKRHLPLPEGYARRSGRRAKSPGYPIEDTWNCSDFDELHSIQILSFSREKVGAAGGTQKNEALLARMLEASSAEGELVIDPFAGTGTTACVATKSGRRWVSAERSRESVEGVIVPRLERVLSGEDRYGVSERFGWRGGGAFTLLELERFEDALDALPTAETSPEDAPEGSLGYVLAQDGRVELVGAARFTRPWHTTLRVRRGGEAGTPPVELPVDLPVDLVATFSLLLGLSVEVMGAPEEGGALFLAGPDAEGRRVGVLFRELARWPNERLEGEGLSWIEALGVGALDVVYASGGDPAPEVTPGGGSWRVEPLEEAFARLLFEACADDA